MGNIRIERTAIDAFGLKYFGADHLMLVYQHDPLDNGEMQHRWWVIEGTRAPTEEGNVVIGVDGADGITTLIAANKYIDPTALIEKLGVPWVRGSRIINSVDPFNDWALMATRAEDIQEQEFPYFAYNFPLSSYPTANSSSLVASLLYYIGIDITQNMPTMGFTFTTGTQTLLGTSGDDQFFLQGSFNTVLAGDGRDWIKGKDSVFQIDKLYGGRGDDILVWSTGSNFYHGGQPDLDYEDDGFDTIDYAGIEKVHFVAGDDAVPHSDPTYYTIHSTGIDRLYSIDRVAFSGQTDVVTLGPGVNISQLRFDLQLKGEEPESKGDVLDFSERQSGLLVAPTDRPDVVLAGAAAPDGQFADGGFWVTSLEWVIGSDADDRIYAGPTIYGVEGGTGNDVLSGRSALALSGNSPLGYDIELSGGEGDDTLISGGGRSLATGGEGADSFILSSLSQENVVVEFVIAEADEADRLFVPFNFLVPAGGDFAGSMLFPILGAMSPVTGGATFATLPQNPGPGPLGGYDQPGFFYLASQVPLDGTWSGSWGGTVTLSDQILFNRDGNDLLIHVWGTGEVYGQTLFEFGGQDFAFQEVDPDPMTETVIRVVDFEEGMLGIRFYELGTETPFPYPPGTGTPEPDKIWNTAAFESNGDTLLRDPLAAEPDRPIYDQPGEGETDTRDVISGTDQDDDLIVVASAGGPYSSGANMSGGGGNDLLTGGARRDLLNGGTGDDTMAGGAGDDRYVVDSAGDAVIEAAHSGLDSVTTTVDYVLPANVEHLTLTGGARTGQGNELNNRILGSDGDDHLLGHGGNDRLSGGLGNDFLDGGTGDDLYSYAAGAGLDTIVNGGVDGGNDKLRLTDIEPDAVDVYRTADGQDVILRFADAGRVILKDYFIGGSITAIGFEDGTVWDAAYLSAAALSASVLLNDRPFAVNDDGFLTDLSVVIIPSVELLANDWDFEGDDLTIVAVQSTTDGVTVSLTVDGGVRVEAGPAIRGLVTFDYTISDGHGGETTASVSMAIVDNVAPALSGEPIADQVIDADVAWSYAFDSNVFTDADGHALFYSVLLGDGSPLPDWLSFDAETRLFEALAPAEAAGDYEISVTATDGLSAASTTFMLSVAGEIDGLFLTGTSLADVLTGGAGNDTIIGDRGNDILSGGAGDDVFRAPGIAGFDIYDGGSGFDLIRGSGGDDVIGLRALPIVNAAGVTTYVLLAGIEAIEGGNGFDVLRLENSADYLDLSNVQVTGIEEISAGGGADTVIGSAGDDVISGGGHHDTLFGGLGDDTFVFAGSSGFDNYDGGDGFDAVLGSSGNDILLLARGSADLISIESIGLGDGFDILRMHTGSDVLDLSRLEVTGLEQIEGGAGSDWIRGSSGNEIIFGGTRQDVFYLAGFFGQDTIADFELRYSPRVNGDVIDLTSFGFSSFQDVLAVTHDSGGSSVIELAQVDSSITILNIAKSLLEPDNFLI